MKDFLSTKTLVLIGCVLAFAPFTPEPHLFEKYKMFQNGTLTQAIDIFDIFWHTLPFWVLLGKYIYQKFYTADENRDPS